MADDAVDPSYVQVEQDSTGKKIRNLVRTRVVLDGVPSADGNEDRYTQIVALADSDGRLVSIDFGVLTELLAAQQETNDLLLEILAKL
jgi:hypothetical protein